jgi:hypothetical protein
MSNEIDSVNFVKFCAHDYLYTGSASRLNIYNSKEMEKIKSVSKTADMVNCISFRDDDKLFAVGNSAGSILVF